VAGGAAESVVCSEVGVQVRGGMVAGVQVGGVWCRQCRWWQVWQVVGMWAGGGSVCGGTIHCGVCGITNVGVNVVGFTHILNIVHCLTGM